MKLLSRLPFKTRLTIFFSLTLVVTLSFIVVPLTKVATERILEDNRAHLSLLTEQVLINFDQYMSSTDKQLYNLCNSLNIAAYMRDIIENEANTQSLRDLQYAVNQMVSTILPFDFVMVKTLNGIQIHTGGKLIDGASLAEQASSLYGAGWTGTLMEAVSGTEHRMEVYILSGMFTGFPAAACWQGYCKAFRKQIVQPWKCRREF